PPSTRPLPDALPILGHALVDESVDLACDEAGLVVLVIRHIAGDFLALPEVGPQLLGSPLGIAVDHGVRRGEDGLRGAVVLLQEEDRKSTRLNSSHVS